MRIPVFLLPLSFFLFSCSFDYDSGKIISSFEEGVPNSELYGVREVEVQRNEPVLLITSDEAQNFKTKNEVLLKQAHFYEYNREGSVRRKGTGERLRINTESKDFSLEGKTVLYSLDEKARLTGKKLRWENETKTLVSEDDEFVTIIQDRSVLEGKGFKADLKTNTVSFQEQSSGTLVTGDESSP